MSLISLYSFWNAIKILVYKPHVVNKRLWGSKTLYQRTFSVLTSYNVPFTLEKIGDDNCIYEYLKSFESDIRNGTQTNNVSISIECILVKLLPKSYKEPHAYQVILLHKSSYTAAFYDVTPENIVQNLCPTFTYMFKFQSNNDIELETQSEISSNSYHWLKTIILPQLVKWAKDHNVKQHDICSESLTLVSSDKYYFKYNELKIKYGKKMVETWPECTDPIKFVYEDVAIATYILLLWENERINKNKTEHQSFVDLGCGNGLLVYILSMEGHKGVGIDVRRRHIWDLYCKDIQLIISERTRHKKKWIEVTGRTDWIPTKQSTICSKHFTEDDFLPKNSSRRYL